MKKHAKILGSLGAAIAVSLGIFAAADPAMAADLIPVRGNNTSADVNITVRVVGEAPAINIETPLDGAVIVGKDVPVSIDYENALQLHYELIHVEDDGTKTSYDLPIKIVSEDGPVNGTDTFTLNLDDYGGKNGTYILKATADGAGSTTDSVEFEVYTFDYTIKGVEESTNNPIVTITPSPTVHEVEIQVYDEDGNAIFEEPIVVVLDTDSDTDVTLPLAQYGVSEGSYRIVVVPYDEDGNILEAGKEKIFDYTPVSAPEVPDTGSILEILGLSRQDFVSTGIALLFVCAFFGVLIIAKKNRDQKQRRR